MILQRIEMKLMANKITNTFCELSIDGLQNKLVDANLAAINEVLLSSYFIFFGNSWCPVS